MTSFTNFGLLPSLVKTLKEKSLLEPTEIQSKLVPLMLERKSVVGIAETGSGKTLAYALPILHLLKTLEIGNNPVLEESSPRAIIMVPTRELGEQVAKVFKTFTHDTRLRVRLALGGMALEAARRNVAGVFEILLATPGRLTQLLELKLIDLAGVRLLILDEADQMMDHGFLPDTKAISARIPERAQLGLFSATVSPAVEELINTHFTNAEVVRTAGSGKVVGTLVTKNITVEDGKRWPHLEKLLAQSTEGGTLLFTNTREQCDRLAKELTDHGFLCGIYRGEMEKQERRQSLKKFREGKVSLLVSTDLAGRGLDIESVGRVINYHLPKEMENYLHRVGRTARAGRSGLVINLVTERDEPLMAQLEGRKSAARTVKHSARSEKPAARSEKPAARSEKPAARSEKPAARSQTPSARTEKPSHRADTKKPSGHAKPATNPKINTAGGKSSAGSKPAKPRGKTPFAPKGSGPRISGKPSSAKPKSPSFGKSTGSPRRSDKRAR